MPINRERGCRERRRHHQARFRASPDVTSVPVGLLATGNARDSQASTADPTAAAIHMRTTSYVSYFRSANEFHRGNEVEVHLGGPRTENNRQWRPLSG